VTQFLCDSRPSHLLPPLSAPRAALDRARINFFLDTWNSKLGSWYGIALASSEEEKEKKVEEFLGALGKEIEPLLKDASPFFGGADKLTLVEVS